MAPGSIFSLRRAAGERFAQFDDFDFGIALDAAEIVVEKRAHFFAPRLAEHDEANFHALATASAFRGRQNRRLNRRA